MQQKITLSLAGCHQGQKLKGVEYGFTPFLTSLNKLFNKNYELELLDFRTDKYFENPIYGSYILGNNIFTVSNYDSTFLTFGGDHTISYGTIIASKKLFDTIGYDTKVIWIDAHADINSPSSSLSGNCHGMPVSYLLGITKDNKLSNVYINPEDLVYIGIRSLDKYEEQLLNNLKKEGLQVYTAKDVKEYGIEKILEIIEDKWYNKHRKYKVHISLDVDSMDPKYTPATGTPVNGGLHPDDVIEIIKWGNKNSLYKLANLDITEINPLLSDIGGVCKTYYTVNKILKNYLLAE